MFHHSETYDDLNSMEHGVVAASGSGKTGKSSGVHALGELIPNFASRKKVFFDVLNFDPSIYPGYELVRDIDDIPSDCVCYIEDMIRVFSSRGSSNKATLPIWLGIISHKDIILMITTQNYQDIDKSLLRSQKVVSIHSYMYENDLPFERDEIKLQQAVANRTIEYHVRNNPDVDPRSIKYCAEYNESFILPLPSWWSSAHSKMFRGARVCQ